MERQNPYAAPQYADMPLLPDVPAAEFDSGSPYWRWQDYLLAPRVCTLPNLCVRCGAPTHGKLRRQRLCWHSPWLYLTILLGVLIYVIAALVTRRSATIYYTLCPTHERLRRRCLAIGWTTFTLTFLLFFVALDSSRNLSMAAAYFGTGMISLAITFFFLIAGQQSVRAKRIDEHVVWLKGLPRNFYEHLPMLRSADGRMPILTDLPEFSR